MVEQEKNLVEQAKQGNIQAFETLILTYEKMVYNIAFRMLQHSEDARDISQEVFLKAYRSLANFDGKSKFSTWLYRIAVNTCIDEIRKQKGRLTYSLEEELESTEGSYQKQFADAGQTPEDSLLHLEMQKEVVDALNTLSEEHRTVVVLRDIQGFSYEEIAKMTNTTLGTVKSRIARARSQLKNTILKNREQKKTHSRQKKRKEGRIP